MNSRMVAVLAAASLVVAVNSSSATPPRELTDAEIAQWRYISTALLTPDGQWLAYVFAPEGRETGEASIVLRSVAGDTERRFIAGDGGMGAESLKMSPSGKWIAFQTAPAVSAVLVEVQSGARRDFKGAKRLEFFADDTVVLQYDGELKIASAAGREEQAVPGAMELALNPSATRLVWTDAQGIGEYSVASKAVRRLESATGLKYSAPTWSKRGSAVALLEEGAKGALIAFTGLDGAHPAKSTFSAADWSGFPKGAALVPQLQWRDDERGLFFSIRRPPQPPAVSDKQNLRIWHYRDDYLPGDKKGREAWPASDWCFVDLSRRKFIRLSDPSLENVEPHARGRYVLGYDLNPYGWLNKNTMRSGSSVAQIRDYYTVDLQSGARALLFRGLKIMSRPGLAVLPQLSPDGSLVLLQDDAGDMVVRGLANGRTRNLTADLPVKFYFPENDPQKNNWAIRDSYGQGDPRVQGWTDDGRYVLISDHYDVWALALNTGSAINLTGNGHQDNVWYRRIVLTEPGSSEMGTQASVNLGEPLYFRGFDLDTATISLARRAPGAGQLETLNSEFADIAYQKALRADVYLYARSSSAESQDYYRIGKDWKPDKRLTESNPQQRAFSLSPGARYLSYKTKGGTERQASLILPSGYIEGRAYPTIVEIYKGFAGGVHSYRSPSHYMQAYLRNGYAVLQPDILPRLDDAARAALEDTLAGVDAAVASGIADRSKLGLIGHSYGGFEANFIVTQTDIFKAVSSHSGMTNMWSGAGAVYADRWPNWGAGDQPYLSRPWWESMDVYLKNSPLYHVRGIKTPLLMASGDEDTAVMFSQSLELFNAMHLLSMPVVMLEYKGAEHDFYDLQDYRDFERRRVEFFDHFVKGAPAPKWWSDGLSLYESKAH